MSNFKHTEPTKPGFYLIKNSNFEMAAELVKSSMGLYWNTTELTREDHGSWKEGTEFKRLNFNGN